MFGLSTGLIVKGKLTLYGGQIDKPNIRIVCWLDTSRTPPCRAKERLQRRLHVRLSRRIPPLSCSKASFTQNYLIRFPIYFI